MPLRISPFFEFLNRRDERGFASFMAHAELDENYIDWNGCVLPYEFGNAEAEQEYQSIRHECALFDVSPMRKIRIKGADAGRFLDHLLTRPVSEAKSLQGIYVVFCNPDGTLKDDAIVFKFSDDDYLLLPSDIDHSAYFLELAAQIGCDSLEVVECTQTLAGLALQGPLAAAVASELGFKGVEQLAPYELRHFPFLTGEILIARMGFTADLGYEFWMDPKHCAGFMEALEKVRTQLQLKIPGYGLSALEACRIEGGFIVAGWDFSTELDPVPGFERNPFEVGLGWAVDLNSADFVGKAALSELKSGSRYVIRRLAAETNEPLAGLDIFATVEGNDVVIGSVNCSSWSWGLQKTIGNASIEKTNASVQAGWVDVAGERVEVALTRGPFVNFKRRDQIPADMDLNRR